VRVASGTSFGYPMRRRDLWAAFLVLAFLPALVGCDLLGQLEGFLSRPTQQEISATEEILASETDCVDIHVRAVSTSGVNSENLGTGDCLVAGSYADFWLLKTSSASDVSVTLESTAFGPYVALFPVDLQGETALKSEGVVDRDDDGDGRAAFTRRLSAGLYLVVANSIFEAESGGYTLRVQRGVN
jgi:hypothetical protein